MKAKATGRPGANVARLWSFLTSSLYQSGDLPVLATREALQNSLDAIRAAIRTRKLRAGEGRFAVSWDPARRALTWEDNGIGMDAETILTKFLSLGDTGKGVAGDSNEAAGGFGVAKAVILGCSATFRWELHSRDNLAVSSGAGAEVEVFDAPPLQGTRLTVFDVAPDFDRAWDYARQTHVGLTDRLRELLAANELPGVALSLDGENVVPMFSRRGGARVAVGGAWGRGTVATAKAYRRPPGDRRGAYYVRLGGLIQFKTPAQRANLKADVVIDLATTVRPGEPGYPLNAARDALQDAARWAFQEVVAEVERENESVGRSLEDEVLDPDSDDPAERRGAAEVADLASAALDDEAFREALAEAAGGIADFYAERAKDPGVRTPAASLAPAGTRAANEHDIPTRPAVLPPGLATAVANLTVEPDIASPADAARRLRATLVPADIGDGSGTAASELPHEVEQALSRAAAGEALDERDVATLQGAIEQATAAATGRDGGGLLQAVSVARSGGGALDALPATEAGSRRRREKRNPFGRLAGLRISKKNYDRARARRFKKGFHRWMPQLAAWDAALRLIAAEARIRQPFKPGFVLDDEVLGLTSASSSGVNVIYIHPDRLDQVIRAHKQRPLAIAAFLHGVACHELTHVDGRMGKGHAEEFVAAREDLGHATGHLLPAIAVLVQNVLRLPAKDEASARRIGRLERQLASARAAARDGGKLAAEVARLKTALRQVRSELAAATAGSEHTRVGRDQRDASPTSDTTGGRPVAPSARSGPAGRTKSSAAHDSPSAVARRVLDEAIALVALQAPSGIDLSYVAAFAQRRRPTLLRIVRNAIVRRAGASSPTP